MLNDLKIDKEIAYINNVPYTVGTSIYDIVKLGDRGEKVDYVKVTSGGDIHKISNGCYFFKDVFSDHFQLKIKDIVGGVYYETRFFFVFRSDGTVQNISSSIPRENKKYVIKGINGIKDVYNIALDTSCVLRDNDSKLVLWTAWMPSSIVTTLEGSQVKLYAHPSTPHVKSGAILTDKALYYIESGIDSIAFPDNLTPDDIKDIQVITDSNLFLLTNDGKVYAIGRNGYNQRGTAKKLKPDEWNQIEYPERIKQIATGNIPGLFAVSESGNLYYHGYNERGYYPFTGRKSNISKPMKILEDVASLWWINNPQGKTMKSFELGNMLLFLDNEGVLRKLVNRHTWKDVELAKKYPTMIPSNIYGKLFPNLIMNKEMLLSFIGYKCIS